MIVFDRVGKRYPNGREALSNTTGHPWDRLYDLATDHQDELGDFSPGWVYPVITTVITGQFEAGDAQ